MSRKAQSARGELVDFDLLSIKDQLASKPVPVGVNQRRKFIDEKDGLKSRREEITAVPDALALAMQAAQQAEDSQPE